MAQNVLTHAVARAIRNRLLGASRNAIDLADHVRDVRGLPWASNPPGFNFTASDPARLIASLSASPFFARCVQPWDVKAGKASFREVSLKGSLHIHIGAEGQESIVHVDSVSVCRGRTAEGWVIYDESLFHLIKHVCTDLKHAHMPVADLSGLDGFLNPRASAGF